MNMEKRMKEINDRKVEIRSLLEGDTEIKLDEIKAELETLDTEERQLKEKRSVADSIKAGEIQARTIDKPKGDEGRMEFTADNVLASAEYRNAYLKNLMKQQLNEVEQRAMTSASNSAGASIPTQTQDEILRKVKEYAPLLGEITLLQVAGNVSFAVEGTVADASKHAEGASITASDDTLATVSLTGYEINKLVSISKTVATMSIDAFEGWLTDMLAEKVADKISAYLISGTGSSEPEGIDKAQTWGADNSVTVTLAGSLTAANVQTLVGLLGGGYDNGAKFLMSKKTLFTDFMPLQDTSKNKIVTSEGQKYYVYGYEVLIDDRVTLHEAYLGNYKKAIVGNLAETVNVVSAFDIKKNNIDYLGSAIFDSKVAIGEAVVKLVKATS